MKKKIIISIVLALILAIAGAAVYVLTNLNSIVKAAIEKYGSQATKTAVRVSSVQMKLTRGEGAILGLKVANPSGFFSPSIITLDDISVRIAVKSAARTPLVIDTILISGPEVFYEMKEDGTANVDILKKNLTPSGPPAKEQPLALGPGNGLCGLFSQSNGHYARDLSRSGAAVLADIGQLQAGQVDNIRLVRQFCNAHVDLPLLEHQLSDTQLDLFPRGVFLRLLLRGRT